MWVGEEFRQGTVEMTRLCSVLSEPQPERRAGWNDSATGCLNDLEATSLISCSWARMTWTLSSAGTINQSSFIWTICVAWASSQHGGLRAIELFYLDDRGSRMNVPADMAEAELPFMTYPQKLQSISFNTIY